MGEIKLQNVKICRQLLNDVKDLYFKSFPPEERRSWESVKRLLQADCSAYNLKVIMCQEGFAGFISYWHFEEFCYVEHFAINPQLRGCGIGSSVLQQFVGEIDCPVVLEVELADSGEMARRRIAFYLRIGFEAHANFEYLQPSYGDSLPAVPLMLMTINAPSNFDLKKVAQILYREVYGIKS